MNTSQVPWVFVAILILALSVVVAWHRRRQRQWREGAEESTRNAQAHAQKTEQRHASVVQSVTAEYRRKLDDAAQRRLSAKSDSDGRIASLEHERDTYRSHAETLQAKINSAVKSELASRISILNACRELNLDGALLTNIRFADSSPGSAESFVRQVDHLLITEMVVIAIESKHWRGVVFDGRSPDEEGPAWALMARKNTFTGDFAVHFPMPDSTGGGASQPSMHVYDDTGAWAKRTPRRQVVVQAAALQHCLSVELGDEGPQFIHPAVYYSHPDSHVFVENRGRAQTGGQAEVLTNEPGRLTSYLRWKTRQRGARIDVHRVVAALEHQTTDITGLGSFEGAWTPTLT